MVMMEIYVSPQCPHCRRLVDTISRFGDLFNDVEIVVKYDFFPSKYYMNIGGGVIPVQIRGSAHVSQKPLYNRITRKYGREIAGYIAGGVPQIRIKKMTRQGPITINIIEAPPRGKEKEWVLALRRLIEILDSIPFNV